MSDEAIITSDQQYTSFIYGDYRIRFMTSPRLERYTRVLQWDHGYIVTLAKYKNSSTVEEEYIDLRPILRRLDIEPDRFLAGIKKVRVAYDQGYPGAC